MPPHDLHAWEERAQVGADQLLQRHELVGAAEWYPAREALRDFDACEMLDAFHRVADLDGKGQRQVGDVRERVSGIDRERRQNRKHLRFKETVDCQPLGRRQIRHRDQFDATRRERGQHLLVEADLHFGQLLGDLPCDRGELLGWHEAVGRRLHHPGADLAPQPGDPHHVELVEVGAVDRDELEPLQQPVPLIECFVQHAGVERQPAQLTVEERRRGNKGRRRHGVTPSCIELAVLEPVVLEPVVLELAILELVVLVLVVTTLRPRAISCPLSSSAIDRPTAWTLATASP